MFNIIESIIITSITSLLVLCLANLYYIVQKKPIFHLDNPLYEGEGNPFQDLDINQLGKSIEMGIEDPTLIGNQSEDESQDDTNESEDESDSEETESEESQDDTNEIESEESQDDTNEIEESQDDTNEIESVESQNENEYKDEENYIELDEYKNEEFKWEEQGYNDYDDNEYQRLKNIRMLTKNLAPILEKHNRAEPLEVKVLIHDMINHLSLTDEITEEITTKVLNHFNENKIKQLLDAYALSLTDDSILMNRLDELAHTNL